MTVEAVTMWRIVCDGTTDGNGRHYCADHRDQDGD